MNPLLLILLAAPPAATPSPAPTPTPVRAGGSLSEIARARKLTAKTFNLDGSKPKAAGTAVLRAGQPSDAASSAEEPAATEPTRRARLHLSGVSRGWIDDSGIVWITGTVSNESRVAACDVRITVYLDDSAGHSLGSRSVLTSPVRIEPGTSAGFSAGVGVPLGSRAEVAGDGYTLETKLGNGLGPSIGKADARIAGFEDCK